MIHITHFAIRELPTPNSEINETYAVEAYLNANDSHIQPRREMTQVQARVLVYRGSEKRCKGFIKKKLFWQSLHQWIGYLVAGGLGAVLTFLLQQFFTK